MFIAVTRSRKAEPLLTWVLAAAIATTSAVAVLCFAHFLQPRAWAGVPAPFLPRPTSRVQQHQTRRRDALVTEPSSNFSAHRSGESASWFEPDAAQWQNLVGDAIASESTCVIVRTYAAQRNTLVALLGSLAASRHPGLFITLVDTGRELPFPDLHALADLFSNALLERPQAVSVSRWGYNNSRALFPALAREDFGYVATDLAIEDLLFGLWPLKADGSHLLHCDTFVVTNGDNLYSARFLPTTLAAMAAGADMVGVHWVSHYNLSTNDFAGGTRDGEASEDNNNELFDEVPVDDAPINDMPISETRPDGEFSRDEELLPAARLQLRKSPQDDLLRCGPLRNGVDAEVWAAGDFHINCIDLGAVHFRRWILESTGFRFVLEALAADESGTHVEFFGADGSFFQRAHALTFARTVIVREALMVHQ